MSVSYGLINKFLTEQIHNIKKHNYLVIIAYHGVIRTPLSFYDYCFIDETTFRCQIQYLKRHFDFQFLSKAVMLIKNGNIKKPTAVITFDDGYQNNYDFAYPILREESLPATIFLTTGMINTDDTIWTSRLHHALSIGKKTLLNYNDFRYNLTKTNHKIMAANIIKSRLKKLPHSQMMSELHDIILKLDVNPNQSLEVNSPYRMLNSNMIKIMADSGLIEFGAHTHRHAILSALSYKQQEEEITRSIKEVQELTGKQCKLFAFPNGTIQDYNEETIKILKNQGIVAGVTTRTGINNEKTSIMELRRYCMGSDMNMIRFKLTVRTILPVLKSIQKLIKH